MVIMSLTFGVVPPVLPSILITSLCFIRKPNEIADEGRADYADITSEKIFSD